MPRGSKGREPVGDTSGEELSRPRSFWSGTIAFGLVSVPVDFYPAQRKSRVALRTLAPDGTPLVRRYFCPEHGRYLARDELTRGYEVSANEYVSVTDDEIAALEPERSRDIRLEEFVNLAELDPILFDSAYFLVPSGTSTHAYSLLTATMEAAGKAGIATFVLRGREHLVAIIAQGGFLRAQTMRFPADVRSARDVGLEVQAEADAALVKKVRDVIQSRYQNEVAREELRDDTWVRLRELVAKKEAHSLDLLTPEQVEQDEEGGEIIDLVEVLRKSLGGAEAQDRARRGTGKAKKKRTPNGNEPSKEELYERARELGVEGRSRMSKRELLAAVRRAG